MKILFTRRRAIGSWIIRFVTWSVYSHVDIILDDETVVGAIAGKGVCKTALSQRLAKASDAVMVTIPVELNADVIAFISEQMGKPYDWFGAIGIGLMQDWQHHDKWSCAEFIYAVMVQGGYVPYDLKYYHRITPQHLLMLNYPKVKVK